MQSLLGRLDETDIADRLEQLRGLPFARYDDSQWHVLEALIQLLPLVVVELRSVFRQTGTVDFTEVAGAALAGLGAADDPGDLLLKLDNSISHILVDEFQDTSYTQYELLHRLISGWQRGDGRTLFVVGDPKQSIYLFREADVGLFLRVCRHGLGNIELTPLTLTANFRSQASLLDWYNKTFCHLFSPTEDSLTGAVNYAAAGAAR
ncbi:MAG: UvrD-helicase domain-containing protein, partial [Desulfuromonadales bacterium]|nr:UvrD-helicase domain-containing protein [Desulfuromonadales bacterium]NIS41816.1 UvrD-helicase domain-containing protein [Desulfuromonadales bacterium]